MWYLAYLALQQSQRRDPYRGKNHDREDVAWLDERRGRRGFPGGQGASRAVASRLTPSTSSAT